MHGVSTAPRDPPPQRSWERSRNRKEEEQLRLPFFKCHGHVSECPHRQAEGRVGMALPRSLPTAGKREAKKAVKESSEEENLSLNDLK